jgi:hypothetical protein
MMCMRTAKKTKHKVEYGDFQTPLPLARDVCSLLSRRGCKPLSVLEPTCGAGNFLRAVLERFPGVKQAIGVEINDEYVAAARRSIPDVVNGAQVGILKENFFTAHWNDILQVKFPGTIGNRRHNRKEQFRHFRMDADPSPGMDSGTTSDSGNALQDGRGKKSALQCLERRPTLGYPEHLPD